MHSPQALANNEAATQVLVAYFAEALWLQASATTDGVRAALQQSKEEYLVAAAAAWDREHPGILDTIKPGAEAFFAWADKDGNGFISFDEARAVLQFLGRDAIAHPNCYFDKASDEWDNWVGAGNMCGVGCDPILGPSREQFTLGLQWVLRHRWEQNLAGSTDLSPAFESAWSRILEEVAKDLSPPGILDAVKSGAEATVGVMQPASLVAAVDAKTFVAVHENVPPESKPAD